MNLSGRQLPPSGPRRRKERDEMLDLLKPSTIIRPPPRKPATLMPKPVPVRAMAPTKPSKFDGSPPAHASVLLAGYMAHEFLTKGTLLGQLYDPARANVSPASFVASSADIRTAKKPNNGFVSSWEKGKAVEMEPKPSGNKTQLEPKLAKNQRYVEVCELLRNGARIPGIVNPSQLAPFLQTQPEMN
ncbi:hypothetical protein R6Q57_002678 [Mikania cordata]